VLKKIGVQLKTIVFPTERVNPLPPGEKPHIGDYFRFEITFGKRGVCAN
jgi:hypothetical protein